MRTSLHEWAYLDNAVKSNPDCSMSGTPPVFSTDVLRIFGEEYDADNDSDHEEDLLLRGPPGEYLEEAWHAVAVDAVCVHIRGEAEVTISFGYFDFGF